MEVLYNNTNGTILAYGDLTASDYANDADISIVTTIETDFIGKADGYIVSSGSVVLNDISVSVSLATEYINKCVGEVRSKYITDIPAQESVYLEKLKEAQEYDEALSPTDTDYELLYEEAQSRNMTVSSLVTEVLTTAATWRTISAKLEGLRMGYKDKVSTSTTESSIQTHLTNFDTDLVALGY